jgi:hypothetical protein
MLFAFLFLGVLGPAGGRAAAALVACLHAAGTALLAARAHALVGRALARSAARLGLCVQRREHRRDDRNTEQSLQYFIDFHVDLLNSFGAKTSTISSRYNRGRRV